MNKRRISLFMLILLFAVTPVLAGSLYWRCPKCGQQLGPFDPRDQAYMNSLGQQHLASCRASAGGGSSSVSGTDPTAAMMPVVAAGFWQLGEELGKAIWGDPQQQAQQAALAAQEAERQRQLEAVRRAQAEEERRQAHNKLLSELNLAPADPAAAMDGSNSLGLMLMDDAGLHPAGTSFFGLGGGPQLQKLQNAVQAMRKNYEASPAQAEQLALDIFEGKAGVAPAPSDGVPVINEEGLRRFQQANNDYRLATDQQLVGRRTFAQAETGLKNAQSAYKQAVSKEAQATLDKMLSGMRELYRQRMDAFVKWQAEAADASWLDKLRRLLLREMAFPEKKTYAEILERERQLLKPAIADRIRHARLMLAMDEAQGELEAWLWSEYRPVNDPRLKTRLENLLARLQSGSNYPDRPKAVKIIGDPVAPGGDRAWSDNCWASSDTIYVGADFIGYDPATGNIRKSDDEILFVMGHEIGHVQKDHYGLTLEKNEEFNRIFDDSYFRGSELTEQGKAYGRVMARNTMLKDFNQEKEIEADRIGAYMALAAGAKPEAIGKALSSTAGGPPAPGTPAAELQMLERSATHPDAQARLAVLEKIYGPVIR